MPEAIQMAMVELKFESNVRVAFQSFKRGQLGNCSSIKLSGTEGALFKPVPQKTEVDYQQRLSVLTLGFLSALF